MIDVNNSPNPDTLVILNVLEKNNNPQLLVATAPLRVPDKNHIE